MAGVINWGSVGQSAPPAAPGTPAPAPQFSGSKVNWGGLYTKAASGPQYFNPASIKDVPSLNQALRSKQINQNQWNQQFKAIQSKLPGNKPVGGYTLTDALHNAVHQGANIALATPRAAASTAQQIGKQFQYLSGPTNTQRGLPGGNQIIQNQAAAAKNPEYLKAAKAVKETAGDSGTGASIIAQRMAVQGAKAPQIQHYLNKQAQALNRQTAAGFSNAAILAGVNVAGGGLLSKALGTAKTAIGKDEAVSGLINTTKAAQATQLADKAGNVGSKIVKEANTTHIPVTEPTITKIPVQGKSTQVVGKATSNTEGDYVKQSQQLSKAYDKEVAALKDQPAVAQKVMQPLIDKKYQALQQKLDDSAGKTSFAFNSKPRAVKETPVATNAPTTSLPRSRSSVHPWWGGVRGTVGESAGKGTSVITDGTKVSGSALRTEQKAVEKGLQGELGDKATYDIVSHKQEAANAVDLIHSDPEKAMQIAMGQTAGNNASHEAAVYHAVANDALTKAQKTGDYSTVTQLATSPRHTGVSEAAQKLGAEGYNVNPHDPIKLMNDVSKTREAAIGKRTGSTVAKETANIGKQVKSNSLKVSREDWHTFVESLKC